MGVFVPLTGEPLAIDFINTRALLPRLGWVDALETLGGLELWLSLQQERLVVDSRQLTTEDLWAVRELRDQVAAAVDRARDGRCPSVDSLEGINSALAASPASVRLAWRGDGLVQEASRLHGVGAALLTQLAEAAAALLTDPKVRSLRNCAMEDCVMLFYPTNPLRKWCIDAICGNRARVARHYRRTKKSAPDPV